MPPCGVRRASGSWMRVVMSPRSNAACSSLRARFCGFIVAHAVKQRRCQEFRVGLDGAPAIPRAIRLISDAKMPGRAGVQVVGELIGEHPAVRVGEHDITFDREQQAAAIRACPRPWRSRTDQASWSSSAVRSAAGARHRRRSGPRREVPLFEHARRQRTRNVTGNWPASHLKWFATSRPSAAVHIQEVDVVDDDQPGCRTTARRRSRRSASSVALPRFPAGMVEEPAQRRV